MLSTLANDLIGFLEVVGTFLIAGKVTIERHNTLGRKTASRILIMTVLGFLMIMGGVTLLLTFGFGMKVDAAHRIGTHVAAASCLLTLAVIALRVKRDS